MARKQKIAKRPKAKTVLRLPDLEQSKKAVLKFTCGAEFPESYGRDGRVHRLVLLRAPPGIHPNGGSAIPLLSGIGNLRARHHQRPLGRGAEALIADLISGVIRQRFPQRRLGPITAQVQSELCTSVRRLARTWRRQIGESGVIRTERTVGNCRLGVEVTLR
jgi:hypothetical protein